MEEEALPLMMLGRMLIQIWSQIKMLLKVGQRRGLNLHIPAHFHALVPVTAYLALTSNLETLCLELLKHAFVLIARLISHSKAAQSLMMIDVLA